MARLAIDRYYDILKYFIYSESSKSGLIWACDRNNKAFLGDDAGSKHSNGYYTVTVGKSSYLCHIIVYLIHNKTIKDGYEVDHFDGDTSNNLMSNLREVTPSVNSKNRAKRKDNVSGYIGISYRSGNNPGWRARVTIDGKVYSKSFHINEKLSEEDALKNAISWRVEFIKKSNAGFTERNII